MNGYDFSSNFSLYLSLENLSTLFTENGFLQYDIEPENIGRGCYFLAWPTGHDYIVGFIGGQFAWNLSKQGQNEIVEYALSKLESLYLGATYVSIF